MDYYSRPQSIKKIENQLRVLEYFDAHGGTISEIACALGMPRSTVQRYLNDISDPEKLKLIKDYLSDNKKMGNQNGGIKSQNLHGYMKRIDGKFSGHKRQFIGGFWLWKNI